MSKSIHSPVRTVELWGGPHDGKLVPIRTVNGFLPGSVSQALWQGDLIHACSYVADVTRPTMANGTHRYTYRP